MRFLYVMDPMCSWCYAFQPELEAFLHKYPDAELDWIMGGLAPDSNQPMEESLKQTIASYWRHIEQQTQVSFNHDFWKLNTPYRSTYPACRAVISAERLKEKSAQAMVKAIQAAYYQEAKNPSLEETLIACAGSIDLDEERFADVLRSEETEQDLQQHLGTTHLLQVSGFPALIYADDQNQAFPLTLGYCSVEELDKRFNQIKER